MGAFRQPEARSGPASLMRISAHPAFLAGLDSGMDLPPGFGEISGIPPGTTFDSRRALAEARVHRPLQAGICGRADVGAESIVLNGGYVDDQDSGDTVLYTGAGANDPGSKRQVAHQSLTGVNQSLVTSERKGWPVRVVRGSHHDVWNPASTGYRYDGLYYVDHHYPDSGQDGFRIWRFLLVAGNRSQAAHGHVSDSREAYLVPRREAMTTRIVRDASVARAVKRLHAFRCQVCGQTVDTPGGPYAEAAHIQPLGHPHNGPDVLANVLCLCPNHHVALDQWAFAIADDFTLIGLNGMLRLHPRHAIGLEYVRYHRGQAMAARLE